jgi:transposase InsO family protein
VLFVQNNCRDLRPGYGRLLRCMRAAHAAKASIRASFRRCYGIQFTNRKKDTHAFQHIFDRVCKDNGIEHRLTKVNHPWTNGQVERMNRTIKDATVKRYHYDSHEQLRSHLGDFVSAYNFARRLKTLSGLTPYEFICKIGTSEPERFRLNPTHQMPGLNT